MLQYSRFLSLQEDLPAVGAEMVHAAVLTSNDIVRDPVTAHPAYGTRRPAHDGSPGFVITAMTASAMLSTQSQ